MTGVTEKLFMCQMFMCLFWPLQTIIVCGSTRRVSHIAIIHFLRSYLSCLSLLLGRELCGGRILRSSLQNAPATARSNYGSLGIFTDLFEDLVTVSFSYFSAQDQDFHFLLTGPPDPGTDFEAPGKPVTHHHFRYLCFLRCVKFDTNIHRKNFTMSFCSHGNLECVRVCVCACGLKQVVATKRASAIGVFQTWRRSFPNSNFHRALIIFS